MIEEMMKAVKRGNKKRSRNITIGAVVGFLLSCTAVMGTDEYLWIKEDNGTIKFSTDNSDPAGTDNPYSENNWDGSIYINNIALSGRDNNAGTIAYGLKLEGNLGGFELINNGSITGTSTGRNGDGLGIYNSSGTIESLTNNGLIAGTFIGSTGIGYGINNNSGVIRTLTNSGLIIGMHTETGGLGSGITNEGSGSKIIVLINNGLIAGTDRGILNDYNSTITRAANSGLIAGKAVRDNYDGLGIYNEATIEALTNIGLITGTGIGGEGSGVNNELGTITSLVNSGLITGTSEGDIGSGIFNNNNSTITRVVNNGLITGISERDIGPGISNDYNSNTITRVENNGLIEGISESDNGYGIFNNDGSTITRAANSGLITGTYAGIANNATIEGLANSGIIAEKDTQGEGYGINNQSTEGIGHISNSGVIYGKTSAINNTVGGEIGSVYNNGILATKGDLPIKDDGTITLTVNYGLEIAEATGIVSNGSDYDPEGPPGVVFVGYNEGGYQITRDLAIKNAVILEGGTGIGTSTDSFEFLGAPNEFDNLILNGKNETLKVTGTDKEVKGSIINAYGTAVIFEGTDGQLTLSGTIVNGGVDEENKITVSGSGAGDTLILQSGEVQYSGGKGTQNTIINGNIDMKAGNDTLTLAKGTIINGNIAMGADNDTLTAEAESIINGSFDGGEGIDKLSLKSGAMVNGNIAMGAGNDTLTAEAESIINGSFDGGAGDDNLSLKSGAMVNGNITMGNANDTLTIEAGSIINGTLDGGMESDTLSFNSPAARTSNSNGINIHHNISGFENMNINTNVTLFEKTVKDDGTLGDLAITGAENITIETDGVLTLKIDSAKTANLGGQDKIIGHALYGNNGEIISTGGKLLLAVNGAGNEKVISFGDTTIDGSLVTAHETKNEEEINFAATSLLHWVKRVEGTTNEVIITSKVDLPTDITYEKLNKIYHSIHSVDELGNFNVDDDEKLSTFLGYLNDIYAGNPYSYSSELSRKSAGMFRDIVTENVFKPEANKWMIYGGLTHVDGGTKDTYYGKGYYTYDIGSSDMDADTKITGAYMLGEYGVSDTLTSGIVIGGNKLKSDLSNGSKVDGSALYLGAYAKKYIGNLKVTAGTGFQYGDYDVDRLAINSVASDTAESVMKYSDNYNDITYDIYLNGRYLHNIGENLFLEPYGTLSYTYIDQDGANEGSKTLAIETDSKSFDYTSAKVGLDLKKVIPHEKGKSTMSVGVSYTKILDGADEEVITGRFKGGSDFDILVAHKNEHSIGVNAKYALELENGVLFDVKGTYIVERDSHNNSGKNRTKGEWIVGTGLGYRF